MSLYRPRPEYATHSEIGSPTVPYCSMPLLGQGRTTHRQLSSCVGQLRKSHRHQLTYTPKTQNQRIWRTSTNHRCAPATTPLVSLQFLPGVLQWRDRQERAAPAAGACRWTWRALAAHHPVDSKVPPLRHPRRSPPRPGSGRSARGARGVPQLAARLQAPRPRSTQRRCSRPAPADHSRCKLQAASRVAGFTCVSNGSARHSASGLTCTVKLPGETPVG